MKVNGQLERVQLELLVADPAGAANLVNARIWKNTSDGKYKVADGVAARAMLINDDKLIIGNSVTASQNIRLHRGDVSLMQFVLGNDATVEGTKSTSLGMLSFRNENYTTVLRPAAGNAGRVIYDTDLDSLLVDTGADFTAIGGDGGSGFNYIENGKAFNNTDGWVLYNNTVAGVRPDDFGGVTAGLTFTRDTTNKLINEGSFKLVKDAVNRQGQGLYTEFTNQTGHATLKILLDMFTDSSHVNLADADLAIYLVGSNDAFSANFQVIEPNNPDVLAGVKQVLKQIQFLADDLTYRLCIHVKSTNALAYDFFFDEVEFGPKSAASGYAGTTMNPFTPVFTNLSIGAGGTTDFYKWREGDREHITGKLILGTGGSVTGTLYMDLPNSIDQVKSGRSTFARFSGKAVSFPMSGHGEVVQDNANNRIYPASVGSDPWNANSPFTWAAGNEIQYDFSYPVKGWESNARMSEDLGARTVLVKALGSTTNLSGITAVSFTNTNEDNTSSFDGTTFTAPETAEYLMTFGCETNSSTASGNFISRPFINGSEYLGDRFFDIRNNMLDGDAARKTGNGTCVVPLLKGQLFQVMVEDADNGSLNNARLSIVKLSSPQTMLENETVSARYTSNSGQSITNVLNIDIVFEDKVFDTHDAMIGSTYIFPVSGKYRISSRVELAGNRSGYMILNARHSGTTKLRSPARLGTSEEMANSLTGTINALKGETLILDIFHNTGTVGLSADGTRNYIDIERIK